MHGLSYENRHIHLYMTTGIIEMSSVLIMVYLQRTTKSLSQGLCKRSTLDRIHSGHQGIQRSLEKAREYVFWVNYTRHIKETTEKCTLCQEISTTLSTERFKYISTVPPHPWHTLGTDLFYYKKQDFIVIIDYFSKYLLVRKIPNSTPNAVIKELSLIFTEFGRPFILRSDNGPCYISQEFQYFLKDYNVKSITSSPYHHQSNGLAESMVKTSKNLIEKSLQLNKPWFYLLQEQRITPLSDKIPSPAEILFGRRIRSNLLILPSQLMNNRISRQREEIAKKEQKYIRTGPGSEMDLEIGQPIWHQDHLTKKWHPGRIHEELEEPHSCNVEDARGQIYRRIRNWIKPDLWIRTQPRRWKTFQKVTRGHLLITTCILHQKPAPATLLHRKHQWMPFPLR